MEAISILLIYLSLIGLIFILLFIVIKTLTKNIIESFIQLLSICTGYILFLGAKALGVSMPNLLMKSLLTVNITYHILLWGIPTALLGYFATNFFIKILKKNTAKSIRVLLIVLCFTILQLKDIYTINELINNQQIENIDNIRTAALFSNLTFYLGILLYIISKFEPSEIDIVNFLNKNKKS